MQNENRQNMNSKSKQELLGYQSHLIQENLTYFKPTKLVRLYRLPKRYDIPFNNQKNQSVQNFSMMKMVQKFSMKYALFLNIIRIILKLKSYKQ